MFGRVFKELAHKAIIAGIAVSTAPAVAFASANAVNAAGIGTLKLPVINFTIFAVLLVVLYKKYVAPLLEQNRLTTHQALEGSAAELRAVDAELETQKARFSAVDGEVREIQMKSEQEADSIVRLTLEQAEEAVRQAHVQMSNRIEREVQEGVMQVRKEIIAAATGLAREQLQSEFNDERDREFRVRVLDEALRVQ